MGTRRSCTGALAITHAGLCTYPLTTCGAAEFLDVAGTPSSRCQASGPLGKWSRAQLTSEGRDRPANHDLEHEALERTTELEAAIGDQSVASEALQEAQKALRTSRGSPPSAS